MQTTPNASLLPFFIAAAVVLGIAHAWTWPGFPENGKAIEQSERAKRVFTTFVFLWAGWLCLMAWYVVVPWICG